jgi:hypothetical protein
MRSASKRRSKPRAEPQGFCANAIVGSRPKRSKRTTADCGRSGRELRKSSAPGSAAIIFVACDGSGSPRQSAKSILRSSLQHHTLLAAARRLNGFEQRRKAKPFSRRLSQIIKTDSQQSRSPRRHRTAQPTIFERRSPSCLSPLAARFNPSYRLKRRHRTQVSKQFRTIGHRLDAPTTRSHSGKQRSFSTA